MTIDNSKRTKCEVRTRVMGYIRPVSSYNIGKKQEFKDRTWFTEEKVNNSAFIAKYSNAKTLAK